MLMEGLSRNVGHNKKTFCALLVFPGVVSLLATFQKWKYYVKGQVPLVPCKCYPLVGISLKMTKQVLV